MNIELRPATDGDREFLLRVYAASREFELSMMRPDEEIRRIFVAHQLDAQTSHYRELYPDAAHDIILISGEPAGRLYVDRGQDQIAILDITVLPEHRKKGIATELVTKLQSEAGGRSLRIFVENFNPAQKLFSELGFEIVDNDGVNLRFEWQMK